MFFFVFLEHTECKHGAGILFRGHPRLLTSHELVDMKDEMDEAAAAVGSAAEDIVAKRAQLDRDVDPKLHDQVMKDLKKYM